MKITIGNADERSALGAGVGKASSSDLSLQSSSSIALLPKGCHPQLCSVPYSRQTKA